MEPENENLVKTFLEEWTDEESMVQAGKNTYLERLTQKIVEKQTEAMTNTLQPQTITIQDIKILIDATSNPVETDKIFTYDEKADILNLKSLAATALKDFFGDYVKNSLAYNHALVAGGVFVSWLHNETPKDIDIFILDNFDAKVEFRKFLQREGYTPKDLDYLKRTTQGGKNVQEIWESIAKHENGMTYQFIFTRFKTREELLADFDFKHCTIAYHKDHLYITKKAYNAAKKKHLVVNNKAGIQLWRVNKFKNKGFLEFNTTAPNQNLADILAEQEDDLKLFGASGGGTTIAANHVQPWTWVQPK